MNKKDSYYAEFQTYFYALLLDYPHNTEEFPPIYMHISKYYILLQPRKEGSCMREWKGVWWGREREDVERERERDMYIQNDANIR